MRQALQVFLGVLGRSITNSHRHCRGAAAAVAVDVVVGMDGIIGGIVGVRVSQEHGQNVAFRQDLRPVGQHNSTL